MTRRWIAIGLLAGLPLLGMAQQNASPREATPSVTGHAVPRSSYDPMLRVHDPAAKTGMPANQEGPFEGVMAQINPHDQDYGAALRNWRIAATEETIDNLCYWSILGLLLALGLALATIWWLIEQRRTRLHIASDIVAQLYNSHAEARAKALEAIERHNDLVELYNEKIAEIASIEQTAEALNEQKKRQGSAAEMAKDLLDRPRESAAASRVTRAAMPSERYPDEGREMTFQQIVERVKILEAQGKAKDQQIANLRLRLNKAHDKFEDQQRKTVEVR
jgi:hypothetical protein